jgi:hypothetical protein
MPLPSAAASARRALSRSPLVALAAGFHDPVIWSSVSTIVDELMRASSERW